MGRRWPAPSRWARVLVYVALVDRRPSCISTLLLTVESITPPAARVARSASRSARGSLLVALGWTRGTLPLKPLLAAIGDHARVRGRHAVEPVGRRLLLRDVRAHRHRASPQPVLVVSDALRGRPDAPPRQRDVAAHARHLRPRVHGDHGRVRAGDRRVDLPRPLRCTNSSRSAAVGAMLWLLWKRTRNPAVLAFVGLHPLLAISVVNGGHPDALVALGVLAGVLLAIDRRPVAGRRRVRVRGVGQLHRARRRGGAVRVGVPPVEPARGREVRGDRRRVRRAAVPVDVGLAPERARALAGSISRQSIWNAIGSFVANADLLRTLASNGATIARRRAARSVDRDPPHVARNARARGRGRARRRSSSRARG